MDLNLRNDAPVLLVITLPQRESDWLMRQIAASEKLSGKFWTQSLEEGGNQVQLTSAMEKVTGRAKSTRIQISTDQSSAVEFMQTLAKRNHPEGIHWMLLPVIQQGLL